MAPLRAVLAGIGALVALAVGCTLLTDLGGLSGGPAADAAADVGRDSGATGGDAAPILDATADVRFCARAKHDFCDDFDDGLLGGTWTTTQINGGPTLSLDSDAAVSPPRSLLLLMPGSSPVGSFAALIEERPTPVQQATYSFDVRVDEAAPSGELEIVDLTTTPAQSNFRKYNLEIHAQPASMRFVEYVETDGGQGEPSTSLGPTPLGIWRHFDVTAKLTPGAAHVTISIDQGLVASMDLHPPSISGVQLVVGLPYQDTATTQWGIHFDNVTLDLQ